MNIVPQNPQFDTTYVVLKHVRAHFEDCETPYFIGSLRAYCDDPPDRDDVKLFGFFPSIAAALNAVAADSPYSGRPVLGVKP